MRHTSKGRLRRSAWNLWDRLSGRSYREDFIRVYPEGLVLDRKGRKIDTTRNEVNNFLNHLKFYRFSAQFVSGRCVADIGCGSGYGCFVLKQEGAALVHGCDASRSAISYARDRYGDVADFSVRGITHLRYADRSFDVTVCSEVLEHLKEYGMEGRALGEMSRVTRQGGLIILGTPNDELVPGHGFMFDEVDALLKMHFETYCLFENALVPFESRLRSIWESRLAEGRVGTVVSQRINLGETCLSEGQVPMLKAGIGTGTLALGDYEINTALLHNTHSWLAVAVNR